MNVNFQYYKLRTKILKFSSKYFEPLHLFSILQNVTFPIQKKGHWNMLEIFISMAADKIYKLCIFVYGYIS